MSDSFHELNLLYLMLIREMVLAGQEQKAMLCFGLNSDAVGLFKKLPLVKIRELARHDMFLFCPRFPANSWRMLLNEDSQESESTDLCARELRLLLPTANTSE